jgi:hypothetical protein
MISWIQNFFHTETKSGKMIFIFLIYLFFWFLAYGVWIFGIIPDFSESNIQMNDWIPFFYFFILIPILSFLLSFYCKKITEVRYIYLIILNILFILISFYFFIRFIISGLSFGGF